MPKAKEKLKQKKLERRRTAIHEASHAVAAWFDPHLPKVKAASIKRGATTLGHVIVKWKWRHDANATRETWLALIRFSLASYAGERLCLGTHARGVWGDLQEATKLAWEMSARFGMGKALGAASIDGLAREPTVAARLNKEAIATVKLCQRQVAHRLKRHKQKILALAAELLERKKLRTKELKAILGPRPERIR